MRRLMKGIAVLSAWLATSISTAEATSFDCAKAQNFAETTICSSPALQRADEDVNSAYVKAVDRVPDKQKADVRQSQRSWLKRRNACTTTSCVSVAMTEQLRTLTQWGAEPSATPVAKPAASTSPMPAAARQAPRPARRPRNKNSTSTAARPALSVLKFKRQRLSLTRQPNRAQHILLRTCAHSRSHWSQWSPYCWCASGCTHGEA